MRRTVDSLILRVFALLLVGVFLATGLTSWLAALDKRESLEILHKRIRTDRQHRVIERLEQFVRAIDAATLDKHPPLWRMGQRMGILPVELPELERFRVDSNLSKLLSETLGRKVVMRAGNRRLCSIVRQRRGRRHCYVAQLSLQGTDGAQSVSLLISAPRPARGKTVPSRIQPRQLSRASSSDLHTEAASGPESRYSTLLPPLPKSWSLGPRWLSALIMGASLLLVAWLVARLVMRPLSALGRAAERFSRNVDSPDLPLAGPREIRGALSAFNRMQARIREHLSQRTHMLAAITHDLQTPLTRLRLRLEKIDDPNLRDQLIADLNDTQIRVREGLELARSLEETENTQVLDLDALLDSVSADFADSDQSVSYVRTHVEGVSVLARPAAIRRCLENLIGNAVKYGKAAEVSVFPIRQTPTPPAGNGEILANTEQLVCICIRDRGPGIPENKLEAVLAPFFRLESSRSRLSGGTGLGLSIVKNLIERQGGHVSLRNHPDGGLEALLWVRLSV